MISFRLSFHNRNIKYNIWMREVLGDLLPQVTYVVWSRYDHRSQKKHAAPENLVVSEIRCCRIVSVAVGGEAHSDWLLTIANDWVSDAEKLTSNTSTTKRETSSKKGKYTTFTSFKKHWLPITLPDWYLLTHQMQRSWLDGAFHRRMTAKNILGKTTQQVWREKQFPATNKSVTRAQ